MNRKCEASRGEPEIRRSDQEGLMVQGQSCILRRAVNGHKHLGDIIQGAYIPCIEHSVFASHTGHMCNEGTELIAIHSHSNHE